MSYQILRGDCREVMATLPDASVDAIVTDPPYGLGFMGKAWDAAGIAYDAVVWSQALRVLKPGGHLLAFGGSRTYHRLACAIEDAGFEIRDTIMWVYGSGFPKSLDVSKAIDRRGGNPGLTQQIGEAIKAARVRRGMTASECDRLFCGGTTNWSWFEGRPKGQRAPTVETFSVIVKEWPELAPLAAAVAEVEREVVGVSENAMSGWNVDGGTKYKDRAITAPATPEAQQWAGWGTALKPALEPITVARKPLVGTVAANVLEHGTGALNVDGCRVGTEQTLTLRNGNSGAHGRYGKDDRVFTRENPPGRWPANLIHDGSDEVVALFPDAKGGAYPAQRGEGVATGFGAGRPTEGGARQMGDSGSAARFFYCAKASKRDRDEGLDHFEKRPGGMVSNTSGQHITRRDEGYEVSPRANIHPTVKPTALMRYLVRLVTPPGGVVLDPFTGSGSTGKAAVLEGFAFIGIEREDKYADIAEARIAAAEAPSQDPQQVALL